MSITARENRYGCGRKVHRQKEKKVRFTTEKENKSHEIWNNQV
jgi:hypothetical protein